MSEAIGKPDRGDQWTPSSWKSKLAEQQPNYPDQHSLTEVVEQLAKLPPLVTSWEIETLKAQLAEAALGKQFLLQGGIAQKASKIASRQLLRSN